jgi:hypothetical protein
LETPLLEKFWGFMICISSGSLAFFLLNKFEEGAITFSNGIRIKPIYSLLFTLLLIVFFVWGFLITIGLARLKTLLKGREDDSLKKFDLDYNQDQNLFQKSSKSKGEKCFYHKDKDAINFCHHCNNHFCSDCLIEGPNFYYCKSDQCKEFLDREIDYYNNPRFCPKCIAATTEESSGDIISYNFVAGDKFIPEGDGDRCEVCNSVIMVKRGTLLLSKGAFRVIFLDPGRSTFLSRRLKK